MYRASEACFLQASPSQHLPPGLPGHPLGSWGVALSAVNPACGHLALLTSLLQRGTHAVMHHLGATLGLALRLSGALVLGFGHPASIRE